MPGRVVIACYRPKPGQEAALLQLAQTHHPRLLAIGLVTERRPILAVAQDGTVVEVFEWTSPAAIEAAHEHPTVLEMWAEYGQVCDYVPIGQVPEAAELFSGFQPLA